MHVHIVCTLMLQLIACGCGGMGVNILVVTILPSLYNRKKLDLRSTINHIDINFDSLSYYSL